MMAVVTTMIPRMILVTCVLYHVTVVTGIDEIDGNSVITETARKCFEDEPYPAELPLTEFPWNNTQLTAFLENSRIPALFPDDQKEDVKAFLALFKKAKLYSLVGSCMGYGHRVVMLRDMFGYIFGDVPNSLSDPDVNVTYTEFVGVPVKLYQPTANHTGLRPAIYFIHGGAWVLGSADEMDGITRRMAVRGDFVVASVDYRLAPENIFPAGLNDIMRALHYFLQHAESFGVDKHRVAVSGDSAGGNFAAAVSLKFRNEQIKPKLKMQVLVYPSLQAVDFNTPSYQEMRDDPYLDRPWMISSLMWHAYGNMPTSMLPIIASSGHTPAVVKESLARHINISWLPAEVQASYDPTDVVVNGSDVLWNQFKGILSNQYFSPLLAESVAGLPHTYMFTCQQDVLRDDGFMYVARLRSAGVKVEHAHHQALHALVDNLSVPFASKVVNEMIDYVKDHL